VLAPCQLAVCAPTPPDRSSNGRKTCDRTHRNSDLRHSPAPPCHQYCPPSRARLTELSILSTKDSNPQALNRTHLWIHWHNQTCCQLSEICVHQSNSENFRNIVEARFGVGLLATLTVRPLLNRRKSVAAHLAVGPLANGCRVRDRLGFAYPSVGASRRGRRHKATAVRSRHLMRGDRTPGPGLLPLMAGKSRS
jgi:DNA-binding transcriptional LysR family regulator